MEFVIKKTTELTESDWRELLDCFIEVYAHQRSMREMKNQYSNTPMGYCVHSLCYDEGRIVAAHTAFPSYYWVGKEKQKVFITGDTMVKEGYRDGSVYPDLLMGLNRYMKHEEYVLQFGFPNDNAYFIDKKGKFAKKIGRLNIYILPYRIGGIKQSLAFFNPISKFFCHIWLICSSICAKKVIRQAMIHKDDETYNEPRYKRLDADYSHIKTEAVNFYYKVKVQEGIRTAFIIDVIGKSNKRFLTAVKYILKTEKDKFDLLMYVGHLPEGIKNIGLIRVPRRFEPKHFYMTGKIISKGVVDNETLFDIKNWDVNLSDYDVI